MVRVHVGVNGHNWKMIAEQQISFQAQFKWFSLTLTPQNIFFKQMIILCKRSSSFYNLSTDFFFYMKALFICFFFAVVFRKPLISDCSHTNFLHKNVTYMCTLLTSTQLILFSTNDIENTTGNNIYQDNISIISIPLSPLRIRTKINRFAQAD